MGARVVREDRRAPLRDPDVRHDRRELLGLERRPEDRLHAPDDPLGLLDARADRRLDVDAELRLVGGREELRADQGPEPEGRRQDQEEAPRERHDDRAHDEAAVAERPLDEPLVERLHALEEPDGEPGHAVLEPARPGIDRFLGLEHAEGEERRHRPRDQERGEQRDRDREGEGDEEELDLALEEDRRHEHDDRRDRRREDRHRDLARGVEHGLAARGDGEVQVPVDVLELHDRVVHEPPDGQREAAQREDVERLAEEVHADEGQQNRERDRDRDDQRRGERAQEDQDHDEGERGALDRLVPEAFDRLPDVHGLVEGDPDVDPRRDAGDLRQELADLVHDRNRVRAGLLVDAHEDAAGAVDAHDGRLGLG